MLVMFYDFIFALMIYDVIDDAEVTLDDTY